VSGSAGGARREELREDLRWLRRAVRLADRGRYEVAPNPMVGAVLVREGQLVAEGWHRRVGGPHAEVEALAAAGARARGATLYVSLEPCNHWGRTPPCVDAVLAAGIARVVAAHLDPDPRTAGSGLARLRAGGVATSLASELGPAGVALACEASLANWRFLAPLLLARPVVTLKWAMSLDGRIATAGGESRWISGTRARRWALAEREQHDAILVGSGTVLADDPRLDRRLGLTDGPILRAVLDRRLRTSTSAELLRVAGPLVVYTISSPDAGHAARAAALRTAGVEVVALERVDPAAALADLGRRGVRNLLVEGGGEVAAAFVATGYHDRLAVVVAPRLIGGREAPGPLGGLGVARLAEAARVSRPRVRRLGEDLLLEAWRPELLEALAELARPGAGDGLDRAPGGAT
jgi:diaminohydroxyphosphoribosylaminopyrimidine deaminase/5-amino-6-(5-phosphoribosylamino)uracil reductase